MTEHRLLTTRTSPTPPLEVAHKIPSPITSPYTIHNISANTEDDGITPFMNGIDGDQFVWEGFDGNDYEIFWYNGTDTIQLTNNYYHDLKPWIHDGQVVWVGNDSVDYEIYHFNGTHTNQLTDNSVTDHFPQIHNGQAVWLSYETDEEIYFFNGTDTIHLASGIEPQIHNGQVAWRGGEDINAEIYFCPNPSATTPTIINISSNNFYDLSPSLYDGKVAWIGAESGDDYEVFFYDGATTTPITSNDYDDLAVRHHDGEIVWHGYVGGADSEVFHYNGTDVIQFTDNNLDDRDPYIHEGQVVWISNDGNDYEVHVFDGTATIQLTNNSYEDWDPRIHNGWVVWEGFDGNDYEIFLVVIEDIWSPVINHPLDQSYALGTTGHSIAWHPSDWNPTGYNVTGDGTLVDQDIWTGGSLTVDIDGLALGLHNYTCTVWDVAGTCTSDAVLVYIYEITIPIPFVPLSFMIGALIVGVVIGLIIGLLASLIYRRVKKA